MARLTTRAIGRVEAPGPQLVWPPRHGIWRSRDQIPGPDQGQDQTHADLSAAVNRSETPLEPRIGLPAQVRQVLEEARDVAFQTVALAKSPPEPKATILISVLRNERPVLDDFLRHYRGLGVDRFVVLDNGSTDGSVELLARQADVDLYQVRRRFLPLRKQGWINRAIAQYGYDRWYVYADADEHLVFDSAGARSLADVIAFAESRGLRRLRGMLVDMYAPGPIFARTRGAGCMAEAFPLYDGDTYRESLCKERISRKGGPRGRLNLDPELTKYPIFHIKHGEVFANPHHIYPYMDNFTSSCYIAILHYKFNANLVPKIYRALRTNCYFNGSAEYRHYFESMIEDGDLVLTYSGSRAYGGPADLLACGLIEPIAWPGGKRLAGRGRLQHLLELGRRLRRTAAGRGPS